MNRVIFDIFLFLSVFLLPWWVVLILSLVGIFIFDQYYESVVAMILLQVLYSGLGSRVISSTFYYPLIIIIVYYLLTVLKKFILIKNI